MSRTRPALSPHVRPASRLLAAAGLALAALAGGAAAAPWTTPGPDGVVVDWSAGVVRAPGLGPADRHAPSPAVARVAARRAAIAQARARLDAAVRALPLAAGGTVGAALEASPEAAARFAAELERAPVVAAELHTDGSTQVTLALGVEAVRQALVGPRVIGGGGGGGGGAGPGDDGPAVTWIIDATAARPAPAVGLALSVGGARWDGPVVWVRRRADAPAAAAPIAARAAGPATGGVLAVSGRAAPPPPGALVVVVVPEKKP